MATIRVIHSPLFNYRETGEYLHTSERHIRRLWQEGKLPGVKIGGLVRFKQSDCDLFIARNRIGS